MAKDFGRPPDPRELFEGERDMPPPRDPEWFLELEDPSLSAGRRAELERRLGDDPALAEAYRRYRGTRDLLRALGVREKRLGGGKGLEERILTSARSTGSESRVPAQEGGSPGLPANARGPGVSRLALFTSLSMAAASILAVVLLFRGSSPSKEGSGPREVASKDAGEMPEKGVEESGAPEPRVSSPAEEELDAKPLSKWTRAADGRGGKRPAAGGEKAGARPGGAGAKGSAPPRGKVGVLAVKKEDRATARKRLAEDAERLEERRKTPFPLGERTVLAVTLRSERAGELRSLLRGSIRASGWLGASRGFDGAAGTPIPAAPSNFRGKRKVAEPGKRLPEVADRGRARDRKEEGAEALEKDSSRDFLPAKSRSRGGTGEVLSRPGRWMVRIEGDEKGLQELLRKLARNGFTWKAQRRPLGRMPALQEEKVRDGKSRRLWIQVDVLPPAPPPARTERMRKGAAPATRRGARGKEAAPASRPGSGR